MDLSQKIKNIETLTPFSLIRETLLNCEERRFTITETAESLHGSILGFMESNNVNIIIEKEPPPSFRRNKPELRFEKKE